MEKYCCFGFTFFVVYFLLFLSFFFSSIALAALAPEKSDLGLYFRILSWNNLIAGLLMTSTFRKSCQTDFKECTVFTQWFIFISWCVVFMLSIVQIALKSTAKDLDGSVFYCAIFNIITTFLFMIPIFIIIVTESLKLPCFTNNCSNNSSNRSGGNTLESVTVGNVIN